MVKSGTSYSGYFSSDGTIWTQVGSTFTDVSLTSPKVGIFASNGGASRNPGELTRILIILIINKVLIAE